MKESYQNISLEVSDVGELQEIVVFLQGENIKQGFDESI